MVFVSSRREPEVRQRAFAMGGDDFVEKPVNAQELRIRLVSHLRRSMAGKELELDELTGVAKDWGAGAAVAVAGEAPALKQQHRRMLVVASFVLIAFWFVFYYPLLAAVPVPWPFYNWHVWFGRAWI